MAVIPSRLAGAILCAAVLGACVPPPTPPRLGASLGGAGLAPPADAEYLLGPGDEIEITFARTPEFNSKQIIRADGAISLPGLEPPGPVELMAANRPVRVLERELEAAYGRELRAPTVAVTIKTYGAASVYVTGEVTRPGAVPFSGRMSVLQAVAAAEGFKSTAKLSQILVIRAGLPGRSSWRVLDLSRALRDGDLRDDASLAARDVIYVPRSRIANVGEFVDLYIRKVLPVEPGVSVPLQ